MIVSSMYSVFATNKMDELMQKFEKTGALTLKHHLENDVLIIM